MIDRSNEFRDNEPQNGDDFFFLVNLVVLDSSIDSKDDSVHVHRTRSISFLLRVTRMDEWNRGLFYPSRRWNALVNIFPWREIKKIIKRYLVIYVFYDVSFEWNM